MIDRADQYQGTAAPAPPPSPNGNASLAAFGICVLVTAALIVVVLVGDPIMTTVGLPLFVMSLGLAVAGFGLGIRSWRVGEERFRYLFGIVFNAIMIFSLVMILVIYFLVRANLPSSMM
jgi:hypothetical protein